VSSATTASEILSKKSSCIGRLRGSSAFTREAVIAYKRKTHDLKKLAEEAAPLHPELRDVLPRAAPEDQLLFDLLRRAYIDARYVRSYRIPAEELAALGERVRAFAAVVERVCQEKIASLRAAAEASGAGSSPAG
jgi:hypothetical protein